MEPTRKKFFNITINPKQKCIWKNGSKFKPLGSFLSCKIKLPNYVLLNSQIPQNERPIKTKNMLFVYFKSPADKGHKPNITNPQATIG